MSSDFCLSFHFYRSQRSSTCCFTEVERKKKTTYMFLLRLFYREWTWGCSYFMFDRTEQGNASSSPPPFFGHCSLQTCTGKPSLFKPLRIHSGSMKNEHLDAFKNLMLNLSLLICETRETYLFPFTTCLSCSFSFYKASSKSFLQCHPSGSLHFG